jgi:hypothetical protein
MRTSPYQHRFFQGTPITNSAQRLVPADAQHLCSTSQALRRLSIPTHGRVGVMSLVRSVSLPSVGKCSRQLDVISLVCAFVVPWSGLPVILPSVCFHCKVCVGDGRILTEGSLRPGEARDNDWVRVTISMRAARLKMSPICDMRQHYSSRRGLSWW